MCGLVGVFGNIDFKMKDVFEDLLHVNQIRGEHSTGVAFVSAKRETSQVIKDTVVPREIMATDQYKEHRKGKHLLMLGHGRQATIGNVNKENAHPFKKKHITLAHNGTLHSCHNLPAGNKFDTDSEAIAESVADAGIKETWSKLNGAATLVWWDAQKSRLNFIRNDKRPLYYCRVQDGSALIWASEVWMLRGVCKRRKIEMKDDQVWYPTPHQHFSFAFKKNKVKSFSEKLEEYKYVSNYRPPSHNNTHDNRFYHPWEYNRKPMGGPRNAAKEIKDNILPFDGPINQQVDKTLLAPAHMTRLEFMTTYKQCIFCETTFYTQTDYEEAAIVDEYSAACGDCALIAKMNNITLCKELLL